MIKFAKVRNVKSPERGTAKSAGVDLFVPSMDDKFVNDLSEMNKGEINKESVLVYKSIILKPQQKVLIPSGIKVNFDSDTPMALIAHNKSGVGSKKGISFLAHVVDQDFQGEVLISVINNSSKPQYINEEDKIIQFVLSPIFYPEVKEVEESELYKNVSERGEGALGSTGD